MQKRPDPCVAVLCPAVCFAAGRGGVVEQIAFVGLAVFLCFPTACGFVLCRRVVGVKPGFRFPVNLLAQSFQLFVYGVGVVLQHCFGSFGVVGRVRPVVRAVQLAAGLFLDAGQQCAVLSLCPQVAHVIRGHGRGNEGAALAVGGVLGGLGICKGFCDVGIFQQQPLPNVAHNGPAVCFAAGLVGIVEQIARMGFPFRFRRPVACWFVFCRRCIGVKPGCNIAVNLALQVLYGLFNGGLVFF